MFGPGASPRSPDRGTISPATPSIAKQGTDVKPNLDPTPKVVPQKRKTMVEQLQEISDRERISRVKVAETSAKEKTAREALKRKAALKMESMRIKFEREENEKKRAHELEMLKVRIELSKVQSAAGAAGLNTGPGLLLDEMGMLPSHGDHLAQPFNGAPLNFAWDKSFSASDGDSSVGL